MRKFPTRSNTNRAVQSRKMVRGLEFRIRKSRDCTIFVVKLKPLISCAVNAHLFCVFVFAFGKGRVSHCFNSYTRDDQKVRGKVLLNRIVFIDCNENSQI